MEDLEITTLPVADRRDLPKLRTLGYDDEDNAAQVRLSDLLPQQIQAASIDFMNGLYIARQPFVPGTSEVYVNGLRYTLGKDYKELVKTMPPMASNSPASKATTKSSSKPSH